MQLLGDQLILSPSDLVNYLECPYLTFLDSEAGFGRSEIEPGRDDAADLLARKGDEHEQQHLARLREQGHEVVEIDSDSGSEGLAAGVRRTVEAMRAGAEVIYQAVLFDGVRWRGYSDFLHRVDHRPSSLGSFSYEVADTKLARRVKPYFLLQLCCYSELVAAVQGVEPELMHVVLGSSETQSVRVAEYAAYYRTVKARFERAVSTGAAATYPEPVEHCGVCRWEGHCAARRDADDHLSLVARIQRSQRVRLDESGITTLTGLAHAESRDRPPRIARGTFETLRAQARLQHRQRTTGEYSSELLELEPERGFERLPKPSVGDVFFDMEGDPFFDDGLEYLFGAVTIDGPRPEFRAFWATDRKSEKHAFEQFIDFVIDRLDRFPELHVYHYASYEETALKRLMGLHATREDEVDRVLRSGVLVDLYAVVRQALRTSQSNYSIKSLEAFYMAGRETEVTGGGDSIIAFEQYLDGGDRVLLDAIERYNEDDCRSTHLLHRWLLERREEAAEAFGRPIAWKPPHDGWEPDPEAHAELDELRDALMARVPEDPTERDADQRARWLMAQLLDYHRREARPQWWAYFDRLEADEEQLVERDAEALGGLTNSGRESTALPSPARSLIHTLRFPPQEHKIKPGAYIDPATEASVTVESIDDGSGLLQIRRGARRREEPLPQALIPRKPISTPSQRAALRRLGADIVERGLNASGRYRALRQILHTAKPTTAARKADEDLQAGVFDLEEAKRITEGLEASYLFIQGPPGSGKTYTGAHLILHLIDRGYRIGVASGSHAAIHNLLAAVELHAPKGHPFAGLKKYSDGGDRYESPSGRDLIENSTDITDFASDNYKLVAGTAWLFSHQDMDDTLDYLFIDEAGQISLADALAMGTSAENLVLLGDPQQLAQVSQGAHPPGAGVSVLEHLLGEHTTIPPDRGLFLDLTRRMHPDVCRFISDAIYESRLGSASECAVQRIDAPGELSGTGVRYVPVEHHGNTRSSPEEASRIALLVEDLLRGDYTKANGTRVRLEPDEIMVVSPYNAQVRCLEEHLPDGVRVGTVDKFQGQQAAACFFSMATSSGDEIPRNLEFLFSRNRLNVAISRARCLATLVCSPDLLHIRCRNAEQMRLINALCWLVEMATEA